jgi:hypothetical protein
MRTFPCYALAAIVSLSLTVTQARSIRKHVVYEQTHRSTLQFGGLFDKISSWFFHIIGFSDYAPQGTSCTCTSCTTAVWNSVASGETCGNRINYLWQGGSSFYPTETAACAQVGGIEFPSECGACDPTSCDGRVPLAPAPAPAPEGTSCTCTSCTNAVWNSLASGETCGNRISYLLQGESSLYPNQTAACARVAGIEFPLECGACDPTSCDGRAPLALAPAPAPEGTSCTCTSCTNAVWNSLASGETCGNRINYLLQGESSLYPNETAACARVAGIEFPLECGACDPTSCDGRAPLALAPAPVPVPVPAPAPTPAPVPEGTSCTCTSCTNAVWNSVASGETCGNRINYLLQGESSLYPNETAACARVAGIEFPSECGACDPTSCDGRVPPAPSREYYCGCKACTLDQWKSDTDGVSCEARITWLQAHAPSDEEAACRQVASQFPASACGTACNPATCDTGGGIVVSPLHVAAPQHALYCYPVPTDRMHYENAWGDFLVQVKESNETCGPGNNKFSRNTVSMANNNNDLKLQFKYINDAWVASEVRIFNPVNGSKFTYGTYKFSIKTVTVKNSVTGATVANELPASLVLGLFTWDDTEDYATHENWNHEVDIEISQWDDPMTMKDAQFLVHTRAIHLSIFNWHK